MRQHKRGAQHQKHLCQYLLIVKFQHIASAKCFVIGLRILQNYQVTRLEVSAMVLLPKLSYGWPLSTNSSARCVRRSASTSKTYSSD